MDDNFGEEEARGGREEIKLLYINNKNCKIFNKYLFIMHVIKIIILINNKICHIYNKDYINLMSFNSL